MAAFWSNIKRFFSREATATAAVVDTDQRPTTVRSGGGGVLVGVFAVWRR